MNTSLSSGWCPVDARDVATARTVLSLAQQTFGNPATLVQKLLGLSADDYQEVVQSLSASGASYVDIVAAYLHNLRVLYDDCGGQFPPEIFTLSTQGATEQMVKDVCHAPASPSAAAKLPSASQSMQPGAKASPVSRSKPAMSISVPGAQSKVVRGGRTSLELSPRSTLAGPTAGYASSTSPTSPNSILLSPRPSMPPMLSPASAGWGAQAAASPQAAAMWQAQLQQAAQLNYQQLLAQSSLAQAAIPQSAGMSMPMPINQMQFSTADALMSAQAAYNTVPALHPSLLLAQAGPAQQYVDALAASLQSSMQASLVDAPLQQAQQHQYPPAMPCAYTACLTGMEDPRSCSPTYGLSYDAIKRIWEAPGAGAAAFHHVL